MCTKSCAQSAKGSDRFSNTNPIALELVTFDPTPLEHYLTGETIRLGEFPPASPVDGVVKATHTRKTRLQLLPTAPPKLEEYPDFQIYKSKN